MQELRRSHGVYEVSTAGLDAAHRLNINSNIDRHYVVNFEN